jgi:hypothetical protein
LIVSFAAFIPPSVFAVNNTITVKVLPTGAGTVTALPALSVLPGVTLTLTAVPAAGYYFQAWVLENMNNGTYGYYSNVNPTKLKTDSTGGVAYAVIAYFQQVNQWVRYQGNPILSKSADPTSWFSDYVSQPKVFARPDGSFGMAFEGCGPLTTTSSFPIYNCRIGLATSVNGFTWTPNPTPILSPGGGNVEPQSTKPWDNYSLNLGSIFFDQSQGKFLLYYSAQNDSYTSGTMNILFGIGLAKSADGVTFTPANEGDPVISKTLQCTAGGCPFQRLRSPSVVKSGSTYMMWLNGKPTAGGSQAAIFLETSTDGISWSLQNGGSPVLTPEDWNDGNPPFVPAHIYAWDGDELFAPSVVYDPLANNFKMFYSGLDYNTTNTPLVAEQGRTGFATSPDGINWTSYPGNPIIAPAAAPAWDAGDTTNLVGAFYLNSTLMVYYSADTFNSQQCIDTSQTTKSCVHYVTTSIGLLYASEIPVVTGWNLISLPVVPNNNNLKTILGPQIAAGHLTIVWSYLTATKAWISFTPPSTGTLTTLVDGKAYWVRMTTADTIIVGGTVIPPAVGPPSYVLPQGWNLLGFKPQPNIENETVSFYLSSIAHNYDPNSVYIYNNLSGSWTKADGNTWLLPGQGLWIYVTSATPVTLRP